MPSDRRLITAAVAGLALGFLDFMWIKFVPFPLGDLGNSSAVWAVAAFLFGLLSRSTPVRAALGAAVLLVVAVPSYYVAAALIQHDGLAAIWARSSLLWMFFGVLAGAVFGTGGAWARRPGWHRTVGAALPAAVLLAEGALQARRIGDPNYGDDPAWLAAVRVVLAVLLIVLTVRPTRQRLVVLAASVPLAVAGFAAFALAGFA